MPNTTKITKKQEAENRKQEAIKILREKFEKAGFKAHTVLKHVSGSGMTRRISVYVVIDDEIVCLDHWIAELGTFKLNAKGGLTVGGCGMDMGFHLVYTTSHTVFDGAEGVERDAGYKVSQRWM